MPYRIARGPAGLDPQVAAIANCLRANAARRACPSASLAARYMKHADSAHPLALLRPRRERPHRRAAEQRDELAADHSITSAARASSDSGIVSPSALAGPGFMTRS